MNQQKRFSSGLEQTAWSLVAAFGAYFCMYGFRKPFTVAEFADISFWGIGFKTILITAQVLGYTLAKFVGIRVIAEMPAGRRAAWFIGLIMLSEAALFLMAITPAPFNAIWLFGNGLALGMVFGLVLGFLEGRQQTEALAAGLCVSFIVADGVVKTVGAEVLRWGFSESWMPFVTGLLFLPPQLVFIWMLARIPPPSVQDVAARSARAPMNRTERSQFFRRYAFGLITIVLIYILCTVLRSLRADFAVELWSGLGVTKQPAVFSYSELAVGLVILVLIGTTMLVKNNRTAFFTGLSLSVLGFLLIGLTLWLQSAGMLSALVYMIAIGVGLYLPYITVHTILFERLLAMTRERGNIGYLMYVADAFGYLGYVVIMFLRNLIHPGESFLDYFNLLSWIVVILSLLLLIPCWYYFAVHPRTAEQPEASLV